MNPPYEPIPEWLREAQRQRRFQRCECVYPAVIDTGIGYRCERCGGWLPVSPRRFHATPQLVTPMPKRPRPHPRINGVYLDPEPPPKPIAIIGEWTGYIIALLIIVWLFIVWSSL